jgi:hypothetical protein
LDLDASELIASIFIGLIGMALFVYAKKQSRFPHGVVGVILMVYPYFVPNAYADVAIAIALLGALWAATRFLNL